MPFFFLAPVQVLLYDERRKILDSRFLKKDEVIGSGESISFDTHLVEIGDANGNHKPLFDLNNQLNNENIIRKAEVKYGQKDLHGDKKAVVKGLCDYLSTGYFFMVVI